MACDDCERLRQERDTFYMDYRLKCDAETKAAHERAEKAEQENARLREEAVLLEAIKDAAVQAVVQAEEFDEGKAWVTEHMLVKISETHDAYCRMKLERHRARTALGGEG
jgi:hypothetical protein